MRPLRPDFIKNKIRPSKFLESFRNKYGSTCTSRATDMEIKDNLKSLYIDLAFGNFRDQDIEDFMKDDRIIYILLEDCEDKLIKLGFIINSLQLSVDNRLPMITTRQFSEIQDKYNNRFNVFSIIQQGLLGYNYTRDSNFIRGIGVNLSTPIRSGLRKYLFG